LKAFDFKEIAEELLNREPLFAKKLKSPEAIYRTSIGRYYYYIFLELREILFNLLPKEQKLFLAENSQLNHHCIVARTLDYLSVILTDYGIKEAYESLRILRKLRNVCDYHLSAVIKKIEIQMVVRYNLPVIEAVSERLQKVDTESLKVAFEQALHACK
jgi:hypothetical protein